MNVRAALPSALIGLSTALLLQTATPNAAAQAGINQEFKIDEITPSFVNTPDYNLGSGPSKRTQSAEWLEVEVEFSWEPSQQPEIPYVDELTIKYYILLNNKSKEYPQGALLVGEVTHVNVPVGKERRSVMYVSPRTLERFFGGRAPNTVNQAIQAVGIEITGRGQIVAQNATKGNEPWWQTLQQIQGEVLDKNNSPFAPLFWDYYEPIKAENR